MVLISGSKKRPKNADFFDFWGFGGLFEKTYKKSKIYVYKMHDLRPLDLI